MQLADTKTPQEVFAETREAFLNGGNAAPSRDGSGALSGQNDGQTVAAKPKSRRAREMPPIPTKVMPARRHVSAHPPSGRKTRKRDNISLTLHAAIFFNELKISPHTIAQRHLKHEQILNDAGMDADSAPAITLTHGLRHRVRLFRRRNVIVVRAPRRGKGAASGLRQSFNRALAIAKLRALETQSPDAFEALTLHAKSAEKATRTELRKYLLNTNGRGRFAKALAVKLFGVIEPIRIGRTRRLPASQLGLSGYGNRSDWREDATLLLMEIETHKEGYRGVLNETNAELRKAKASRTRAERQGFSLGKMLEGERMIWGYRRRREVRRAEARAALQQIRLERLNRLRVAFRL